MYVKRYTKMLVGAVLIFTLLITDWSQADEVVINGGGTTTWTDAAGFDDGDDVTVNNASTLEINGDASGKVIATLSLGKTTGAPDPGDGTGTLNITGDGEIRLDNFVLGVENEGHLNIASGGALSLELNSTVTLHSGTITNEGTLHFLVSTVNWTNTNSIVFGGTGTRFFVDQASGANLTLLDGITITTGALDASNYTLTGGTLSVSGVLTLDATPGSVGTIIELANGSSWTLGATQDPTDGEILINGGTLLLGADTDYEGQPGTFTLGTVGTINLNDHDLNLGDVGNFNITDGGRFISGTLGTSTLSLNAGTLRAAYNTFFSGTEDFDVNNANVTLSGNAELEIYDSGSYPYTVVYDFSLSDTATIVGGADMLLYVQGGANITTGGTNTTDFTFLGRSVDPVTIDSQATFEGKITVTDVFTDATKKNEIVDGVFNGEVAIQNWNDVTEGSTGSGYTEISGGTFNNIVTLEVRPSSETNEQNKAIISGGTFNDTVRFLSAANASITGGSFDSLDLIDYYFEMGTLHIDGNIDVNGADGVFIEGGTLNINAGNTLSLTDANATLLMQPSAYTAGGILTGDGTLAGNVDLQSGIISGNLTINGNLTQTGGLIAPGNSIGAITVTGDLSLADTEIEIDNNGNSDTIEVGGATTLADGGTMTIKPLDTSIRFDDGDHYNVIQSAGGFVDSGGYIVSSGVAGFNASGAIVGTDYIVTLEQSIHAFPAGAYNANHLTNYLYDLYEAGEDHPEVMAAIQSDTNQQLAAEKFSGESHATGMQSMMNVGMIRLQTLNQQIRPNRSLQLFNSGLVDDQDTTARGQFDPHANFERTNIWYAGYGMGGHIAGDENTSPTIVSFSGMMIGFEGIFDGGSRKVGVFYDRSHVATDVQQLEGKNNVNTNFFGGYLTRELENGYRLFTLGFGEDRYQSRRIMNVGSGNDQLSEVANSGYHGWQSTFYTERGYELQGDYSALQPYVGLQYSYLRRNAFNETDATYSRLDFEAADYDSLRFYLGTRVDLPFLEIGRDRKTGQPFGGLIQLQTAWIHEMLDKTVPICNAQLGTSGLSNNFIVDGADCGRDWWLFSVGTRWRVAKSVSFYGDYTLLLNTRQTFHTGSGGLCLSW